MEPTQTWYGPFIKEIVTHPARLYAMNVKMANNIEQELWATIRPARV